MTVLPVFPPPAATGVNQWNTATLQGAWTGVAKWRVTPDGAHVEFAGAVSGGVANSTAFTTTGIAPKTNGEADLGGALVNWTTTGAFQPSGAVFLNGIVLPFDL